MLIPLYVLIGVWGGPGRLGATLKFVVYTVAGSLLMLASIVVYGLPQGTFDLTQMAPELEQLALPRLRDRVRGQGAALPVPRLAARRLPRGAARGRRRCSPASSRRRPRTASCGSRSRSSPSPTHDFRDADPRARRDRARLRLAARVPRARHPRRDRVLVARADGADHARPLRDQRPRLQRRRAADGQPRPDLGVALPARRDGRAAHRDRRARRCSAGWRADDRRSRPC